jgi:hypothetical protein
LWIGGGKARPGATEEYAMLGRWTGRWPLLVVCAFSAAVAVIAANRAMDMSFPQDKGPNKLDVAAYPIPIQAAYRVFEKDCGRCHTLARALNTSMPASYWARYLGGMESKPEYGISQGDAEVIYDFLAYDQANRKDRNPKAFYPPLTEDEIGRLRELKTQGK